MSLQTSLTCTYFDLHSGRPSALRNRLSLQLHKDSSEKQLVIFERPFTPIFKTLSWPQSLSRAGRYTGSKWYASLSHCSMLCAHPFLGNLICMHGIALDIAWFLVGRGSFCHC